MSALPQSEVSAQDLRYELTVLGPGEPQLVPEPEPPVRVVYEPQQGQVLYQEQSDELFLEYRGVRALCRAAEGTVTVSIEESGEANAWAASRPAFSLPLMELLKRRALFPVHAGAVELDGRAVLVVGGSGAGKTTTAVALARQGLGFLADDTVFLREDGSGVSVLGFPEELDLAEGTIAMFPELRSLVSGDLLPGASKLQLDARLLGSRLVLEPIPPVLLLFPERRGEGASTFERLDLDESLRRLLPNVLLTERASTQAHVDALAALALAAPAYRVLVGSDLETLSDRIGELIT